MTLLLSLSNRSYSIVLGDRRLAQPDGTVGDDEANKLCVLFCDDARVTIAFTGLASYSHFTTQDWLRDTLYEIGKKTHTLADILRIFQAKASYMFAQISRAIGKRQPIAFLVSGFRYSPDAQNICYVISNFDSNAHTLSPTDKLDLHTLCAKHTPTVEAAGYTIAFTEKDREALQKMLSAGNPAPKVLRKAVQIMRRVSMDRKSRGFVGGQCNSGVVPQRPDTNVVATYHSVKPTFRAFGPDVVLAVTDCGAAVTGTLLCETYSCQGQKSKGPRLAGAAREDGSEHATLRNSVASILVCRCSENQCNGLSHSRRKTASLAGGGMLSPAPLRDRVEMPINNCASVTPIKVSSA